MRVQWRFNLMARVSAIVALLLAGVCPLAAQTVSGTIGADNAAVTVANLGGSTNVTVGIERGTWTTGSLVFEARVTDTATWIPILCANPSNLVAVPMLSAVSSVAAQAWTCNVAGFLQFRTRGTGGIAGTATVNLRATVAASATNAPTIIKPQTVATANYTGGFPDPVVSIAIPAGTHYALAGIKSTSLSASFQFQASADNGVTWTPDLAYSAQEIGSNAAYVLISPTFNGTAQPERLWIVGPLPAWVTNLKIAITGGAATGTAIFRLQSLESNFDLTNLAIAGSQKSWPGGLMMLGAYRENSGLANRLTMSDRFDIGGSGSAGLNTSIVAVSNAVTFPVTGTFWQTTQPVSIATMPTTPVTGTFWQATQPVSGTVVVSNFPATQAVTGTFWQATQPVSGTFWQATQPVSGTVGVNNFPATQPVSGTVTANAGTNLNTSALALDATLTGGTQTTRVTDGTNTATVKPASTAAIATDKALVVAIHPSTPVAVTGTFFQATQPVSGTVGVSNFPATQPVSGTVAVSNFPATQAVTGTFFQATQPVSGSISVSNFPATQAVTGTFFQATQPVSLTTLPALTAGTAVIGHVIADTGSTTTVTANAVVSTVNSSTTTLAAGGVFTGTSEDVTEYADIRVTVFADVASATDGLSMQQSANGTNWDVTDVYTIAAGAGRTFSLGASARFFRLVYTNGGTIQTAFRLQTVFHKQHQKASTNRPADARTNETDTTEQTAFLLGYNGATWDRLRSTTANGLAVDVTRVSGTVAGNQTQVNGVAVSVDRGPSDAGTQRVMTSQDATYAASTAAKTATAAGVGAFFELCGSASKTIRLQRLAVSGTVATAAIYGDVQVRKTSAAATGGTATTLTTTPFDSTSAAGTATAKFFTVLPTGGSTLVGNIFSQTLFFPLTGTVTSFQPQLVYVWRDVDAESPVLRGTAQCITIGFGTTPTNAPTLSVSVAWTEK